MTLIAEWRGRQPSRLLFWAAGLFAFVMAVLPHPPEVPGNPSDKVQHIAAFATLALLGVWAYPRLALVKLLVRLSLFGAAIEIIQAIPVLHRDSDVVDWLADTAAVLVVLVLVFWRRRGQLERWTARHSPPISPATQVEEANDPVRRP